MITRIDLHRIPINLQYIFYILKKSKANFFAALPFRRRKKKLEEKVRVSRKLKP